MFFISFQKLFSFSRNSKFRTVDVQIHDYQMPKHKKKCILLNNWECKHGLLMKFGQFISYYKRKNIKEIHKNCAEN